MLMLGLDLLKDLEQLVTKVQLNLKQAQDRQKYYADKKRKDKYFHVDEHVYLKVKEKRISLSLGRSGKLAPRFCRPFEILAKRGPVAYELDLPAHIRFHNVFHTSLLKKYVYNTKHVIDWSLLQVEPEGEFVPKPFHILEKREVNLTKRIIDQLKVQWKNFEADEDTWENEATMREAYSALFHDFIASPYNTWDDVVLSGDGCNIPNFWIDTYGHKPHWI